MIEKKPISILLVDDIPETRENIKKLLSFERDFKVVGMAGTGREGLALARELLPDIVIMDINMPDMDGLQVAAQIVDNTARTGVIMLSAQDDHHNMRRAMMAGAKAFLTKPSSPDELYHAIRTVYGRAPVTQLPTNYMENATSGKDSQSRAGNIIVVYSPQGGAGCTTIATNLASGLMREDVRVLLVDANLQFGDVGVFLNLQAKSSLVDLIENVNDLDINFIENSLLMHNSGLKVLMGPPRPELAEKVFSDPTAVSKILAEIRWSYDFIIVDTSLHLDEITLSLMDIATRIVLVSIPALAATKNAGFVLELFDRLQYPPEKITLVLNRVSEDHTTRKHTISTEKIAAFLKHPVAAMIPSDEFMLLDAIHKGIPIVALQRNRSKSPAKELCELSDLIFTGLMPLQQKTTTVN